jgi:3-dehydroquinate synthase
METIPVRLMNRQSLVIVGECLDNLENYLKGRKTFIITDKNVNALYRKRYPGCPVYVVEPGEQSKDLRVVADICRWLLDHGADRGAFITGIGGGVVCDLAGFVASVYMRGLKFGFVATSLLAQVDAGIGGKNGVDLDRYKNIIGTFTQPEFVICDVDMLISLPENEYINGLAEVIKHSLIKDRNQFARLEENHIPVLARERTEMEFMVSHSARIKSAVVEADELEHGERRKLNLGHTWGHAVEKVTGMPHGESVSVGLAFTASLSVKKGLLKEEERKRVLDLLQSYGLPLENPADPAEVLDALIRDKKREGASIHFILMNGIGDAIVEPISIEELKNFALNEN